MRSLLIGVATGLRSQIGLAIVLRRTAGAGGVIGARLVQRLSGLAATGELVLDKVPGIPSRLERGPLVLRCVFGAVAAARLARVRGRSVVLAAALGATGALTGAFAGHALRTRGAQQGPDVAVALGEDGLALVLARATTTGVRGAESH